MATVSVNVLAVDRAPVATNDLFSTPENVAGNINVTANDSDPDGDALSVSNFTQGLHGAVTFTNTVATYTPVHDFSGSDQRDNRVTIFFNSGSPPQVDGQGPILPGSFFGQKTIAFGAAPNAMVAADFDDNGYPDLAVTDSSADGVEVLKSGHGVIHKPFQPVVAPPPPPGPIPGEP